MRRVARRVREYVSELVEDGLHAGASFVIAWVLFGLAFWYKVNLIPVLNFNLAVVHYVTRLTPYGYGDQLEFILRTGAHADGVLFFGELWFLAAVCIRVLGLCFRLLAFGIRRTARSLRRRKRSRS